MNKYMVYIKLHFYLVNKGRLIMEKLYLMLSIHIELLLVDNKM